MYDQIVYGIVYDHNHCSQLIFSFLQQFLNLAKKKKKTGESPPPSKSKRSGSGSDSESDWDDDDTKKNNCKLYVTEYIIAEVYVAINPN